MAGWLHYGFGSRPSHGAVLALGIVISGCTVTSNGMTPTSVTNSNTRHAAEHSSGLAARHRACTTAQRYVLGCRAAEQLSE